MKLLQEEIHEFQFLKEDAADGKKKYFVEGIMLQADIQNKNGRIYPYHILEREVIKHKAEIDAGGSVGELGHPATPSVNLPLISHKFLKLESEGKNFIGKAQVLDTPMGMIAQQLIEGGVRLGMSSRALGSLKKNRQGINEVQDDLQLKVAGDLVHNPSAPDAIMNAIHEGADWVWNSLSQEWEVQSTLEKINEDLRTTKTSPERRLQMFESFLNSLARNSR